MDRKNVIFIPAKDSSRPSHPQAPCGTAEKPLRAALYSYSSERRTVIGSPQSMEARLRDFVEGRVYWTVATVYCDIHRETQRDQLEVMIDEARRGRFDIIVTQNLSQLGRDGGKAVALVNELAALPQPVGVYFVSEQLYSLDRSTANLLDLLAGPG